jgi:hypothetical protein
MRVRVLLLLAHRESSHLIPSCVFSLAFILFILKLLLLMLLIHLNGQEEQVLGNMLLLLLLKMLLLQLLFLLNIERTILLLLESSFSFVRVGIPGIRSRLLLRILLRLLFFLGVLELYIPMKLWLLRLLLLLLRLTKVLKILLLIIIEPLRWYLCILLYGHLKIIKGLLV